MTDSFQTPSAGLKRQKLILRLAGIAIVVAVALLKPRIDNWLNGAEPAAESIASTSVDDPSGNPLDQQLQVNTSGISLDDLAAPEQATQQKSKPQQTSGKSTSTQGKSSSSESSRLDSKQNPKRDGSTAKPTDSKSPASNASSKSKLGKLKLIKGTRDEFISTAGLFYGPGSVDGHRLKHVLKHAKDNKSKPVHGIFKGDRDQILEWIDLAYELAKKGGRGVKKKNQNDRVVYIVDLGKPIGKMGGQVGARKNFPSCRYLQLVLEDGNHVVTAYPTNRF